MNSTTKAEKGAKSADGRDVAGAVTTTRARLLEDAMNLFAVHGFKGTSIRDIAKMSGMTLSNIYYYFPNKESMLSAILEDSTDRIVKKLREVTESKREPFDRFKVLLKTHLTLLLDVYRKESKILFLDEERLIWMSKQFQVDILNMYRRELMNLQSLGYVDERKVTTLVFNILGAITWHLRWYKPEGPMSVDQIADEMVAFVLRGVGAAPERATDGLEKGPV